MKRGSDSGVWKSSSSVKRDEVRLCPGLAEGDGRGDDMFRWVRCERGRMMMGRGEQKTAGGCVEKDLGNIRCIMMTSNRSSGQVDCYRG